MKRTFRQFLLTTAVLLGSASAMWAQTTFENEAGTLKFTVTDGNNVSVSKGTNEPSGAIDIPSEATDPESGTLYNVTSIGNSAFESCSMLTSINIPESVTSIGEFAFGSCSNLASVTISENVTTIGNVAFFNCSGLTSITVPKNITTIGNRAFYGCTNAQEFVFEKATAPAFGTNVFSNTTCPIYVPTAAAITAYRQADNMSNFASRVQVKPIVVEGVKYKLWEDGTCSVVANNYSGDVVIRSSVDYNGVETAVTSISSSAFKDCIDLTSVTIPEGVKTISGFNGCTSLTSVTIPNSVTSIGGSAFFGCTGLTEITIPENVTSIESAAFKSCSGLETLNFNAKNCTMSGQNYYATFNGCTSLTTITIGENVETIPSYAFSYCSSVKSVTIPASVTSIGTDAFKDCSSIDSLTYNTNVLGQTFRGNTSLKTVVIGNSVTSISNNAFYGCSGLTSINIPESVTSIGGYAFYGCSSIKSLDIPASVTTIGDNAFKDCNGIETLTYNTNAVGGKFSNIPSLKTVTIGDSVTTIPWGAFQNCTNLTTVVIPNSVTTIGSDVFYGCKNLKSLTLPFVGDKRHAEDDKWQWPLGYIFCDSYNYYEGFNGGRKLFQQFVCDNPPSVNGRDFYIPRTLEDVTVTDCDNIQYGAFYNCANLKSVTISSDVTNVGSRAFYGCSIMEKIVFECETPPDFGANVFYNTNNCPIYVPTEEAVAAYRAKENMGDYYYRIMVNPYCKINVAANNDDYGTVSGGGTYNINTTQTAIITATPNEHYRFVRWEEDSATDNPRTVALNGYATFTAVFAEHIDSLAIENIVAPTCTATGSYDSVVYCSFCGIELSRDEVVISATGHKADSVEFENVVAATCTVAGTKDSVVYCSVCSAEISRTEVVIPATGHTEVVDTVVAATCTVAGKTEGSHCSVCEAVLVAQTEISATGHKADSVLFENIVSSTCTVAGSYDSVVYCSVCHVEISRDSISVPATGHKADSVAFENIVEATCTVAGSKDSVVYCSVCKAEVSRTKVVIPAHGHTVVVDSAVAATATTDGLTEGSHCSVCGETIVAQEVIPATGEQGGENTNPATAVAESAAQAVNIYANHNIIVVENADSEIRVYDIMGNLVATANNTNAEIIINTTGVYVVKVGNTAKRVMIY